METVCPSIKNYCFHIPKKPPYCIGYYDIIIAKDVFEHICEGDLDCILKWFKCKKLFACVPLGKNGVFFAPSNNLDVTHVICKDENWWSKKFTSCGYKITNFTFRIDGIKDNYYSSYPNAHGFFTCEKEDIK